MLARRAFEEAGIKVMDVRDVDEMPADIRIDYLRSLHNWQMAAGNHQRPVPGVPAL